jgi:hypothetical protein
LKFKGNFGELTLNINGIVATGTYQENGVLKGEFINNTFKGQWENKGMEGLVEFTIADDKLEGNWKKGLEPGPMKGKWEGEIVDSITKSLKDNFLFQVSLGSKELFHSNLIAWLLEQKNKNGEYEALSNFIKTFAKKDVAIITEENTPEIAREENKIDLTIKWKEEGKWNMIFIENKMKSIPTSEQLNEYNKKTDKLHDTTNRDGLQRKIIKKFLLTPFKSDVNSDSKKWDNITYQEDVITFLETIKELSFDNDTRHDNDDVKYAIKKYISFLKNQNKLLLSFNFNNTEDFKLRNYDFYVSEEMDEVRNLRLHDLILKLAHEKIGLLIKNILSNDSTDQYRIFEYYPKDEFKSGNIYITNGFSRSTGITDIKICVDAKQFIGLQLQGNSLKYITEVFGPKKLQLKNKEFAFNLLNNGLWFYNENGMLLSGKGRNKELVISNSGEVFNSYGLNFIYLNMDVSSYANNPIITLVKFIVNEIKRVLENIDKFKQNIPK